MRSPLWRRAVIWGTLGAAVLGSLIYAFRPQPVPVDMAVVTRGDLVVTVDDEGKTRVRDLFILSAPIAGRARRIETKVGDAVIANETVVAQIEPIDPELLDVRSEAEAKAAIQSAEAAGAVAAAELQQAGAELEFARSEVERARRLIQTKTISERALDMAERTFKTRKAEVDTAKAALRMHQFELARARARLVSPIETQLSHGKCECVPVMAPVSGRILSVLHESEGVVRAGEPLVEIGNPGNLEIVADLLSTDAVRVEPGQRVIVEEWGGGKPLAGRVRRIEPVGFTKISALGIEEQRVNVIIDFTEPTKHWQRLGHGFRVEVRIVLWHGRDALKLPLGALFRDGERWAVFVDESGRAQRRHVVIGRRTRLEAEITGGLTAGERVVLHPSNRVADNVRIGARS